MPERLPIAILIPHSSLEIPPELVDRVILTPEQIFNESDSYTDLIYGFQDRVQEFHRFDYARCIIDVNRPDEALEMVSEGDGIIKRITSYGDPVFAPGQQPDDQLERQLIETYWQTWHDKLASIASNPQIKLVLDCHSMAAIGPSHYTMTESAQIRPRITVCNVGDSEGNPRSEQYSISAPPALARQFGEKFAEAMADIPALAPAEPGRLNSPFWFGNTIHHYGTMTQAWLMIELSRALYIGEQTGNTPIVPPHEERISLLHERLWTVIESIVKTL